MIARDRHQPFPGDHSDKQAARMFLYRHAVAAPVQGHAVTLAGSEPESEVNLLRYYLKWPATRTWFVDNSLEVKVLNALYRVKRHWPDAHVERINLRNLLPRLGAIGFINLDFMGSPLQDESVVCLEQAAERLLPGGILGFTWIRGRENYRSPSCRRLMKFGKGTGDDLRWSGVLRAVEHIDDSLKLIGKYQYLSNHSPMSVAVFRKE
jgi:hypothetical protein